MSWATSCSWLGLDPRVLTGASCVCSPFLKGPGLCFCHYQEWLSVHRCRMDPEEVQMDPVFHEEAGRTQEVTATLCVSILSACLFVCQTVPRD